MPEELSPVTVQGVVLSTNPSHLVRLQESLRDCDSRRSYHGRDPKHVLVLANPKLLLSSLPLDPLLLHGHLSVVRRLITLRRLQHGWLLERVLRLLEDHVRELLVGRLEQLQLLRARASRQVPCLIGAHRRLHGFLL